MACGYGIDMVKLTTLVTSGVNSSTYRNPSHAVLQSSECTSGLIKRHAVSIHDSSE